MADVNANIGVHIDTSAALAELKALQRQLANFHSSVAKNSAAAAQAQKGLQTNLLNSINATGKFHAQMGLVRSSTESFTHALETNKLSMREYFRYAGGSTRTFGKLFKQEFNTIGKVAEERVKKMQTQYIKMGRDASGAIQSMSITPRTLDMNDYATKTALAAQKQALLNQLLKQGSTNLLNFGKNTQWAGRQLMVGFTIPLAYFGTAAAKTFMDLEKQAIRFKRVYGDMFTTTDETNKALADVQKLAEEFTKYGVAVVDTMEMAANAAAMGKTGADLTAQVAEATRLAVLGGVEQAQALETTISVTNAFGVAAEDLAKKINFLNAVENQTVVSIEDLTIAIPKAGPVVKQLGGDVEDLAFFLTAMKEGGINASEGANALKSGLASLINPTEKASKMLAGFGINISAIVEGNQGNIRQTVIDFSRALDTLDPLNRARAIEQLFGKFQFSRLSTLFQNVTKDGTQAARVLDLAAASVEELAILSERELGVLEDAIGTDFKESVEQLKLAIAPIGKEFLKAITPVAKTIGDFLEKFNNLGDGTKKFIVVASTLVGIIGPVLLMTFGLLANGVANIIKLFITMRSGFLRAGANSNLLAQQTQYLNTEQLEAATVAASLNQAHTKLTQSFTAEATAVRLLRQAYIDATIAATNFARTNPAMMMPGGKFKGTPKKFASGVTTVPGTGNKDTVASMLTPGEAVIPKGVAQDPAYQPIIQAMVDGTLQGFESGTVSVGGKSYTTRSQSAARNLEKKILELKTKGYSEDKIIAALDKNIDRGRPMTASQLERRLSIGRGAGSGTSAPSGIRSLAKGSQSAFVKETRAIKEVLKRQGMVLTPQQERNLFNVQASHIEEVKNAGVKQWNSKNLVADLGYINNYLNTVKGKLGQNLLGMSDEQLKSMGIDRNELKKLQTGTHPTTAGAAQTLRNVAAYDAKINPGSYQAKTVLAGLEYRSKSNFYSKPLQTLADVQAKSKSRVIDGQTSMAKSPGVGVVGGAASDVRQVAVGKNETILNKKTTTALKSGKPVFVPGLGRFRMINSLIAGADDGVPKGQTTLPPGKAVSEIEKQFRSEQKSLRRQIEKVEKERIRALKEETRTTQEKTRVVQQTVPLTKEQLKEQKREVRAQRAQRVGRVAGPVASIAGIGAMAGFMTGNAGLGSAMMGIAALATIAPMLTNPLGLFVAGLVAATALIYKFNKDMDKARQKGIDLANAMSMTDKKLIELSKITGKVSASEAANRRRENVLSGVSEAKRQFGQNVLESEIGKQMSKDMSTQLVSGRSQEDVARNFANQLAVSVTQGAITTEQARSIAVALGDKLGDYEIPALISGQLVRILGPDGQNLESDPINVLLNVQKSSMADVQSAFDDAITGANVNAIKGSMPTWQKIIDSLPNIFGQVNSVSKTIAKQQTEALRSQAIQTGINAVSQGQGQLDIANKYYDTKLKTAKTENEIKKIEDDRKNALDQLNAKNAANLKTIISLKNQISTSAFDKTIKTAVDNLYKDADENTKKLVNNALLGLKQIENLDLRTTLQIGMASGTVKEGAARKIVEYATSNKDFSTNLKLLIDSQGTDEAMSIIGLLGRTKASAETVNLFIKYAIDNKEDFSTVFSSITALSKMEETYGFQFDLNTNGKEKLEAAVAAVKQIQDLPNDLTKEIVAGLAEENPGEWAAFYAQWDNLTLQGKNQTVNKTVKIAFDTASKDKPLLDRIREGGKSEDTLGEILGMGGGISGVTPPKIVQDPVDPKSRDTTFDDILVNLKRTRDATINAQGGAKELIRILGGAKDLKAFNGIDQQLSKIGANSDFIDFVGGLEKAIQNKIIKVSKKGVVSLTELGKATKKAYDEKQLGLFSAKSAQVINESIKQRGAFVKLKAAGVETADAQEMLADATFMVSLAAQKTPGEIKKMIAEYKNMKKAIQETLEFTNPEEAFDIEMDKAMKYYDFLEREARAAAQPEIDRINGLIDANEKLIDTKERSLELDYDRPIQALNEESVRLNNDLSLIDKAADGINKKYDEQEKALEKISSLNQEIAQQEKGRLSLADALSRGDIAAAASAAQQMRAEAAQNAMGRSSGVLQAARETELKGLKGPGGLTRDQIEQRLFVIGQQIYALEQKKLPIVAQITALQDTNYNLQVKELEPLKQALDARIKNIDTARQAWESQQVAIQAAAVEADKTNARFKVGEGIVAAIKKLWDDIKDKNVTLTTYQVTKVGPAPIKTAAEVIAERKARDGYLNFGGIVPKYFGNGGKSMGSDTVPAMLTPGEFVMNKKASQEFGPLLSMLNESKYPSMIGSSYADQGSGIGAVTSVNDNSRSVYNYNVGINVPQSNANPNDIARAVIGQIKYIDNQRIRGQR
jgi:TP901 family phage tail tape measure protein